LAAGFLGAAGFFAGAGFLAAALSWWLKDCSSWRGVDPRILGHEGHQGEPKAHLDEYDPDELATTIGPVRAFPSAQARGTSR